MQKDQFTQAWLHVGNSNYSRALLLCAETEVGMPKWVIIWFTYGVS